MDFENEMITHSKIRPDDYIIDHQEIPHSGEIPNGNEEHFDHVGNNLPTLLSMSKMERLNFECSNPQLLKNCVHGQKWRCVNENGQWRKHKCKFHVQLQSHIAEKLSKYSTKNHKRNCACLLPDGLVYTKMKSSVEPFRKSSRQKRDLSDDEEDIIVVDNVNELNTKKLIEISDSIDSLEERMGNQISDEEMESNVDDDYGESEHVRHKRETVDHISAIIQVRQKYY